MRACVVLLPILARPIAFLLLCCLSLSASASDAAAVDNLSPRKDATGETARLGRVGITAEGRLEQEKRAGQGERLLQRQGRQNMPDIHIAYPVLGYAAVDEDVRNWVNAIADTFDVEMASLLHEADMMGEAADEGRYALHGSCTVLRPSREAASLVFEIWTYTGGAHGNLDIITLNYSLITGQRLDFVDIFGDVDKALSLLSSNSREVLSRRLAGGRMDQWIVDGTAQDVNNFASLGLTSQGVRVYFQPYQVAPWAAGAQAVDIPLEALMRAKPFLTLWDK